MSDDDAQEMPAWLSEMRQRELDQFKVGDEVMVTLHGECNPYILHGDRERGVRGIVLSTTATHRGEEHPIWVMLRQPLGGMTSSCYTPGELRKFDIMAEIQRIALTSESPPRGGE